VSVPLRTALLKYLPCGSRHNYVVLYRLDAFNKTQ